MHNILCKKTKKTITTDGNVQFELFLNNKNKKRLVSSG